MRLWQLPDLQEVHLVKCLPLKQWMYNNHVHLHGKNVCIYI
jgi:hypothetical protein